MKLKPCLNHFYIIKSFSFEYYRDHLFFEKADEIFLIKGSINTSHCSEISILSKSFLFLNEFNI